MLNQSHAQLRKKILLAAVASLWLAAGAAPVFAADHPVDIVNFQFSPSTLTIDAGDTVTWTQVDAIAHTTTSDATPPVWDSPLLNAGQTFSFTFNDAGSFPYHCKPHPQMRGTITVQAASPPPSNQVEIVNFTFVPATLTIKAGETVTWVQRDTVQHTTTSDAAPPIWDSGLLSVGQTFSFTFTNAGTFAYHCTPHPVNMKGTIIVEGGNTNNTNNVTGIQLRPIKDEGSAVTLEWTGGSGPFMVQTAVDAGATNWMDLLATQARTATVPKVAASSLYRVVDQTTNSVLAFAALLNSANAPTTNSSTGTGIALFSLSGSNLSYQVSYTGLTTNATAGHIHGPADVMSNASVLVPFTGVSNTVGLLSGTASLASDVWSNLISGLTYVNIHTPNNPGGEIRGQILPLVRFPVRVSGASEVPPILTSAEADGWLTLIGNQLLYNIPFTNLSAAATAAHIHGPANATSTAGVLFPLDGAAEISGTLAGSRIMTPSQLTNILTGNSYVNIHTSANPGGEIRGQVMPLQFTASLSGTNEVPVVTTTGTGDATLSLVGNVLTYTVNYSGLTGDATASHIHGPASATGKAGVLFPLTGTLAASGTLSGTQTLTPEQYLHLVSGNTYVNIHTAANGGGEIRGQVIPRF